MKNTAFCILTRGRSGRQITLSNLHPKLRKYTYLVVDEDEYNDHKKYANRVKKILSFPSNWGDFDGNFSDKKEWTARNIKERYLFFLDDDLKFDRRKSGKLSTARKLETLRAFRIMTNWMQEDNFAHVALSPREGNNRVESDFLEVTRAMRVCGFDLEVIKKHKLNFNRIILMADFDIALSLLELSYPNRVLYSYANGQRKSNDEGGCSLYRTPKTMREAANTLKKLHPKFVKVQEKITKKPWAGFETNKRTDVTVYWKKTFEYYSQQRSKKGITTFLK